MTKLIGPVCIECGTETMVLESRKGDAEPVMIWRTRRCKDKACGSLFTTVEVFAPEQQMPHAIRQQSRFKKKEAGRV